MAIELRRDGGMDQVISGKMLRDAFVSGANRIANERQAVDALNVFPVPDGDTGTNMSMTSMAAAREAAMLPDETPVGEAAQTIAAALLRGARGNSGVILSLLFRGVAKRLRECVRADGELLASALSLGVDSAYQAVMKPTEGTILTVARFGAQTAREAARDKTLAASEVFARALESARQALAQTPQMLPVLAQAGVVDAGGQGLVYLFEGMSRVFQGGEIVQNMQQTQNEPARRDAAGEFEGEITFTYCTEFLVLKQEGQETRAEELRAFLESIGDCVVVVDDERIIKCHAHTDAPGDALQKALQNGMLTDIKIENMREQHENKKNSASRALRGALSATFPYRAVDPSRLFGFVAVAAGEGVRKLFLDLNVDEVVGGGQTMNPSTEDLLSAVQATPAKTVFVLPNNKNIIMAAEQAAKLADRRVIVVSTRAVPQGLTAMLAFDGEASPEENQRAMQQAAEGVGYGLITYAVRDSIYEGRKIKANDILALQNGKLAFTEKDLQKAVIRLTKSLLRKDAAFVTLLYGEHIGDAQAAGIHAALQCKLPDSLDSVLICGGQPVYNFMISVE